MKSVTRKIFLAIISFTFLLSCKSNDKTSSHKVESSQLNQEREAFKRNQLDDYNHWQSLIRKFKNNSLSAEDLGVIDCQNLQLKSEKLKFKQLNIFNILERNYSWNVYKTEKGDCLALRTLNGGFLLSKDEAKVLLSASKGINFKKDGLPAPLLIHQWTINSNQSVSPIVCKETKTTVEKNYEIIENNCEKIINYLSDK